MTPCEQLGYKVGDEFIVIVGTPPHPGYGRADTAFSKGARIRLTHDDGTTIPRFKLLEGQSWDGSTNAFCSLTRLQPAPAPKQPPLDLTKPVQLADGRPATILCTDLDGNYPVVVSALDRGGRKQILTHTLEGHYSSLTPDHRCNLVNAPTHVTKFINVYIERAGNCWATIADTEADARIGSGIDTNPCPTLVLSAHPVQVPV